MFRRILPALFTAGSFLVFFASSIPAHASDLERHLHHEYLGKILVLRGFYSDEKLHYDSGGAAGGARTGDWTLDGLVRVNEIHLSEQCLKIKAERLLVISISPKGLGLAGKDILKKNKDPKKAERVVEIDARLNSGNVTEESLNAVLAGVFLTSQDSFVDVVPEYWKPCIADGLSGKSANCGFSAEVGAAPGMMNPSRVASSSAESPTREASPTGGGEPETKPLRLFRVGGGVKPPRVTYQPEPVFSELARKVKYQGIVTLGLVVSRDGTPERIRITTPLGAGLDAKAIEAVQRWKFQPAQKDGQPVAVQIAVEVDFHLY